MLLPLPFTLLSAAFHAASVGVSQEEMCRQFYDGNALRTIVLRPAGIMDAPHMIDRYAPPELKVWLHQLIQNNSGGVFSFEFRVPPHSTGLCPPGTQSQVTPAHTKQLGWCI